MIPEEAPKKSFWKGLKAEYKRIIWPDKETVTKQTGAVIAVSVALGLIIAALDTAIVFWTALR
ncbi:MAG: preprotein translocase subunit SecE [Clostridium fessum]